MSRHEGKEWAAALMKMPFPEAIEEICKMPTHNGEQRRAQQAFLKRLRKHHTKKHRIQQKREAKNGET